MSDPQDRAEQLDDEVIGWGDDSEGDVEFPPERLLGFDEGTAVDDEPEIDPTLGRAEPVGRLIEPGVGDGDVPGLLDEEATAIAWSAPAADLSAEEEAVHLTEDPDLDPLGDGYVT